MKITVNRLKEIVSDVAWVYDQSTLDDNQDLEYYYGMDSIDFIELKDDLEYELHTKFDPVSFSKVKTLKDLKEYLKNKDMLIES